MDPPEGSSSPAPDSNSIQAYIIVLNSAWASRSQSLTLLEKPGCINQETKPYIGLY